MAPTVAQQRESLSPVCAASISFPADHPFPTQPSRTRPTRTASYRPSRRPARPPPLPRRPSPSRSPPVSFPRRPPARVLPPPPPQRHAPAPLLASTAPSRPDRPPCSPRARRPSSPRRPYPAVQVSVAPHPRMGAQGGNLAVATESRWDWTDSRRIWLPRRVLGPLT